MRAANYSTPNTVLAGNGGGVTNTPINSLSVAQATNANQILDIDSQYKPLNDTLALANVQQSVDSKLEAVNVLQQQLEVSLNQINAFIPAINNIQTQVTNNLNSINQLVNDLRNGNVIFGNAQIDITRAYPKNYLGYAMSGNNKTWYLSQQAVPANTEITNTQYWVNVSEAGTINVDLSNYYTKTESDTKFQTQSGMSDYLTVANANSTFAPQTQFSNYYTKTESDGKYQLKSAMSGYATTSALNSNVSTLNTNITNLSNSISNKVDTSTLSALKNTLSNQSFVTSVSGSVNVSVSSPTVLNTTTFTNNGSGVNHFYSCISTNNLSYSGTLIGVRFYKYTSWQRTTLDTNIENYDIVGYAIINNKLVVNSYVNILSSDT